VMIPKWAMPLWRKWLCSKGIHWFPLNSQDNSIVHHSYHTKAGAQVYERRCKMCGAREEIARVG